MRATTELFTINGQGILVPDADVTVTTSEVLADSARDRSGTLHRTLLRRVTGWEFSYETLTDAERQYMLGLLDKQTFNFGHPGHLDATQKELSTCYCKGSAMDYHDAAKGQWRNFHFRVEEV